MSEKQNTMTKPDPALEEALAIAALNKARAARQRAPRVEVKEPPPSRRAAPEQADAIGRALAEIAGKGSSPITLARNGPYTRKVDI